MEYEAGRDPVAARGRLRETLKGAFRKWSEDGGGRLGAALAYYTIFSIAPLLIVAVGIAGLIYGEQAARGEIVGQIEDRVGETVAEFLQQLMAGSRGGTGVAATVLGVLLTLVGASGLFFQLKGALNVVWDVPPQASQGVAHLVRSRALAFLAVLGIGVLLVAVLAASSLVAALGRIVPDELSFLAPLLQWLSPLVSAALLVVVFALLFKILPDAPTRWPAVWRGAVFTSVLFTIGTFLLGLYIGSGAVGSAFGSAAALVAMLVYAYYSAQMLLLGAEFTRVLELTGEPGDRPPTAAPPSHAQAGPPTASTPAAAVWAFLAGLVVGWWRRNR